MDEVKKPDPKALGQRQDDALQVAPGAGDAAEDEAQEQPDIRLNWAVLRRAVSESVRQHRSMFLLSIIVGLGFAGTTAGLAFAMNSVVNDVFVDVDPSKVAIVAIAVLVLSVLKGGSEYCHMVVNAYLSRRLLSSFQRRIFHKYLELDVHYFARNLPAKHVAQLMLMSRGTVGLVLAVTSNLARDVFTLIALAIVMVMQEPMMALIVAVSGPAYYLSQRHVARKIRSMAKAEAAADAGMPVHVAEAVQGLKIVKAYGLESKSKKSFDGAVKRLESRTLRISRAKALLGPLSETSSGLVIAALIVYAAWQSQVFDRSAGEMVSFIAAFVFARGPARRLGNLHLEAVRKLVVVERLYALLDTSPEAHPDQRTDTAPILTASVEFDGVAVRYGKGKRVVRKANFVVEPGETVAIVGRSGAGKSSLTNALMGFANVDAGRILIDGRDISEMDQTTLFSAIGYVSQDPFLFDGSIRDNIRDGRTGVSDDEIEEAARLADVDAFLPSLADGLDTAVGPNGTQLSGGQRQRVALARAVLRKAPLLLLDEATSAMDGESEARIIKNIVHQKPKTQTLICVSHRYASVAACQRVLVMDKGRIVAQGDPAELAETSELFRAIMSLNVVDHATGKQPTEPAGDPAQSKQPAA